MYQIDINSNKRTNAIVTDTHNWYPIKEISPGRERVKVFNITVDDDCSYIAEGFVVHNCQDLSVAGKREGLIGERSGTFRHAIRVIRGMRSASNNQFPRFIVWENVPGAFSSNNGEDFRTVLSEIAETEIPMPASGKWAEAGMVRTERVDIAWRTLDAQYWGVAQRRKRIYAVADFRGQCAGEILFVEQGLSGDSQESGSEGQEAAGAVGNGTEKSGGVIPFDTTGITSPVNGNNPKPGDPCHTLQATAHTPKVAIPNRINSTPKGISGAVSSKWAKGTGGPAGDECYNLVIEPQLYDMTHADEVMRPVEKGIAPTLNSRMGTGGNQVPPANTLLGKANLSFRDDADTVVTVDCRNLCENKELSGTLQHKESGGYSLNYQNPVRIGYAVRRLTPTECLRLQGFPDWWLDIEGASDTAKYKAIGNSVAIPCVDFVMSGIARVLRKENQCE
jgi:DNA (cytosine-5)-methyltransferase 1